MIVACAQSEKLVFIFDLLLSAPFFKQFRFLELS